MVSANGQLMTGKQILIVEDEKRSAT